MGAFSYGLDQKGVIPSKLSHRQTASLQVLHLSRCNKSVKLFLLVSQSVFLHYNRASKML
jgi:hypothetical protein